MSDRALTAAGHHAERAGYAMVFWAAVFWSTGGFFVRLIPLDAWTLLGWRSLFGIATIFAFALWQQGIAGLQFGKLVSWHGLIAVLCAGIGMICFVTSNVLTSVANVAVLYATLPFMTAGLAWVWIGERPSRRTLSASAAALIGVVVMARESIGGGHLLGDAIAIAMTLLTAILTVTVRHHRDTPILEAVIAGGVLAMAAGMLLGAPADVGAADIGLLALFGALTMGGGMALYTVGAGCAARRICAAQDRSYERSTKSKAWHLQLSRSQNKVSIERSTCFTSSSACPGSTSRRRPGCWCR